MNFEAEQNIRLAKLGLTLSIIGFSLSAISVCLAFSRCINDSIPDAATAQADSSSSDTAFCMAPICYPDIAPMSHP
jgi:hypothetical protein